MMFRDTANGTIAIPQPSHAWISGQIMRAWGNAEFGVIDPFEDVCLAAEQHDIGWLTWEQAPTINPATGRPHGFRDLGVLRHTAIWTLGTAMAGVFGRYPALLVSLHGTGLYAGFDAAAASADEADAVRAFLEAQQAIQRRLLCSLATDPRLAPYAADRIVERNRGLVRTADRMSIAICTALSDPAVRSADPREAIVRDVPAASGVTDIRLRAAEADMSAFTVSPWPFAAAQVRVFCEGVLLPPGPLGEAEVLSAPSRTVAAELRPA
jgi:hypothetical protein